MNRAQIESFLLKHERKKTYNTSNFKKITSKQKKLILEYLKNLVSSNNKIDIRYINLILKFKKNFRKQFLSINQIKKNL